MMRKQVPPLSPAVQHLANQALDRAVPETWTTLELDQLRRFQQVFAELIVQDCISVLQRRFMGDLNREDQEVRRCIADLEQHFSVHTEET
jgi:hypothetical protein